MVTVEDESVAPLETTVQPLADVGGFSNDLIL